MQGDGPRSKGSGGWIAQHIFGFLSSLHHDTRRAVMSSTTTPASRPQPGPEPFRELFEEYRDHLRCLVFTETSVRDATAPSPSSRRIGRDSGSGGHGAAARMPSRGPVGRRAQASTQSRLARRYRRARRTTGQASAWRRRMAGRSEAAVTGCLSESVIKAYAPRVKARRVVAQQWREFQRRASGRAT